MHVFHQIAVLFSQGFQAGNGLPREDQPVVASFGVFIFNDYYFIILIHLENEDSYLITFDNIQISKYYSNCYFVFFIKATCIFGSCIEVFRPWLQGAKLSCKKCNVMIFFCVTYSYQVLIKCIQDNWHLEVIKKYIFQKGFFSHCVFYVFSQAVWHRGLFCLFGCFHTQSLSVALSLLWSHLSGSFVSPVAPGGILLELYSVWVELVDNMKLLSGLHFDLTVLTHHHRVYGCWVQAQLGIKTEDAEW